MTRHLLSLSQTTRSVLAFVLAAILMFVISYVLAQQIASRSQSAIEAELEEAGITWMAVKTDGMQVQLSGLAPDEGSRFRALNLVGRVIDASRIRDSIEVSANAPLSAPRFTLELLRNDDGIQLIGLIPLTPEPGGLDPEGVTAAVGRITSAARPADMLQSVAWPAPEGWDEAVRFGIEALGLLNRSKISVSRDRVSITAIATSEEEKQRLERDLTRRKPRSVPLQLNISAPRPVITPFSLRFIKEAEGMRFDACSAETERDKTAILSAAGRLGMNGSIDCTIGLGAPTPRWAEGAVAALAIVAELPAATITFSDADVTFVAGEGTSPAQFDRALGELRARLADVFSIDAIAPTTEVVQRGPVEFTALLRENGKVELRGRLLDEQQKAAVGAFARGAFGFDAVHLATRLDSELPVGWPLRVLAGLDALSQLENGELTVRPDLVEVKGVTGSQTARSAITGILSSKLGQGQTFRVDVRYDKELDPLAALPTPAECIAQINDILGKKKISFKPGSAEIAADASPVIGQLVDLLRKCGAIELEIAGYTDSQGSDSGNLALSQARADAVLMALLSRRIDTSNMKAKGYGEADPIADNKTEAGREANRRIEFRLTGAAALSTPQTQADPATEGEEAEALAPVQTPNSTTVRPKPRPNNL